MMAGGQMQAISAGSGSSEGGGGQTIVMDRGGEVKVFKPFSFIKKSNNSKFFITI